VAHPDNRFLSAGIYHASDICDNGFPPFSRSLHMCLLKQFKQIGKETQIFIDTRPRRQQGKLLPALEEAILERRIQCVVAPTLNPHSLPPLARLRIPTAFLSGAAGPNRVNFDIDDLLRESARRFKAQGCRTVGVMSTISRSRPGETNPTFYSQFEKAMHAEGLVTRDAWNSKHTHNVRDHESHGYAEFLRFWRLKEKPDGLLVIPDTMARGVITAILQLGMQTITPKMRFIFHRNAQVNLLCPFPVTWAISDETIWAEWLIRIIQKQFSGEKVTPVLLPYCFEEDAAPARG